MAKSPTERMIEQFGQVPTTDEQKAKVATVRAQFVELAEFLSQTVPQGPELTVALRKLLESKDCAIRALLFPQ